MTASHFLPPFAMPFPGTAAKMTTTWLFFLFLAAASSLGEDTSFNFIQPDLGRECSPGEKGTAGIKYYHDQDVNQMFPFFYKGCGGDSNRYNSSSEGPMMMDFQSCSGIPKSTNGTCNDLNDPSKTCASNEYCERLWTGMGGFCCSQEAADKASKDREASKCIELGLKPIQTITFDSPGPLLGRNCSHNFCPSESKCYQGNYYAYCCREKRIPSKVAKKVNS